MKKTTRVVFLGSRPLGAYALRLLNSIDGVEVVAHVTRSPSDNAWWSDDPFFEVDSTLDTHDQLLGLDFDLGVSINYWKILPSELIDAPRLGFINLHHSYNLSLRGRDMTSHAILRGRESGLWLHGSCLHYTDDGLDTGPIIASSACPIYENDTGWSLFHRTEKLGQALLDEWLPRICVARVPAAHPESGHPLNSRNQNAEDLKFIEDISANPLRAYDIVRAFEFQGFFEPAYTLLEGEKIFLSIKKDIGESLLLEIDGDRAIYSINWPKPRN